VPTSHTRIPVTRDPALAEALDRAAAVTGRRTPAATLVHDLAIRGAEALVADHRADGRAIERRVERSASDDPGCDLAVLADVDRLGWGQP
jgi:hypothetical protein